MSDNQVNSQIRFHSSERIVFTINMKNDRRRIFQIQFLRKDGSIVIHFPYQPQCDGLVGLIHLPVGFRTGSLNMENHSKMTSQKIKFVHHPDGETHFSQDSLIITQIRKRSVPLSAETGHIFTIHLNGFSYFERATSKDEQGNNNRGIIDYICPENTLSLKIIGHWYHQLHSTVTEPKLIYGPVVNSVDSSGNRRLACLVRQPNNFRFSNHWLVISIQPSDNPFSDNDFSLMMIGGFDNKRKVYDYDSSTSFLALLYPAHDPDELRVKLGSIDLISE